MTAVGTGGALTAMAIAVGATALPIVAGGIGILLGAGYLLSPTWKLEVVIDDAGLEVRSPTTSRFKLAWHDVVRVVSSPTTHSCFVDGGTSDRSLLVPGDGAPAPYDLDDKPALCAAILAHVSPDRVTTVESLANHRG